MKTIQIQRKHFENYKSKLDLTQIDKNKYIYKKKYKYKFKKLLHIIGMILWIPFFIPVTFIVCVLDSIKDYFVDFIEFISNHGIKNYFKEMKEEFDDILKCIIEIID